MAEFLMPSLGADMQEAILLKWRIKPGSKVQRGDVIGEVDTAKGVIDLECFQEGVVEKLVASEGDTIPVGAVMLLLQSDEIGYSTKPTDAAPGITIAHSEVPSPVNVSKNESPISAVRPKVSPLARRRAEELGVDLAKLSLVKRHEAISVADVELAAVQKSDESVAKDPEASRHALRTAIAAAMSKSKREIPHYYLQTTIDMSSCIAWLEQENAKRTLANRLLPAVVLLKAVAAALGKVPQLNGYWQDGRLKTVDDVHAGFAIAMKGGGLVAPAIHHLQTKCLDALMAELHELIPRARSGRLRSSELTDATITVTSLGDLGVEALMGIIYPPQVALIGFGKILSRPWVESGQVCVKPLMVASLSADHRATDGLMGARFLEALTGFLQEPQSL